MLKIDMLMPTPISQVGSQRLSPQYVQSAPRHYGHVVSQPQVQYLQTPLMSNGIPQQYHNMPPHVQSVAQHHDAFINELKRGNAFLTNEAEKLKLKIHAYETRHDQDTTDIEKLKQLTRSAQTERETLSRKYDALSKEKESVIQHSTILTAEITQLKKQSDQLQAKLKEHDTYAIDNQRELKILNELIKNKELELADIKHQMQQLKDANERFLREVYNEILKFHDHEYQTSQSSSIPKNLEQLKIFLIRDIKHLETAMQQEGQLLIKAHKDFKQYKASNSFQLRTIYGIVQKRLTNGLPPDISGVEDERIIQMIRQALTELKSSDEVSKQTLFTLYNELRASIPFNVSQKITSLDSHTSEQIHNEVRRLLDQWNSKYDTLQTRHQKYEFNIGSIKQFIDGLGGLEEDIKKDLVKSLTSKGLFASQQQTAKRNQLVTELLTNIHTRLKQHLNNLEAGQIAMA